MSGNPKSNGKPGGRTGNVNPNPQKIEKRGSFTYYTGGRPIRPR